MNMDEMRYAGGPFDPKPPNEPPDFAVFLGAVLALVISGIALLAAWPP